MKSKISLLFFFVFLLLSFDGFGMEEEEKNKENSTEIVQYDAQNNGIIVPVKMLNDKNNVLFQVIADPTWEHKKRYPLISYPPQFNNFQISYQIDDNNFMNSSNEPSHKQIREALEDLTIKIQDDHEVSTGAEKKSRSMKVDICEFGKIFVLANKNKILNWYIEHIKNSDNEDNLKNFAKNQKLLQIIFTEQKDAINSEIKENSDKYDLVSTYKPKIIKQFGDEIKKEKSNWFERNPFQFASIIGVFAFFASPFIFNKLNLLSLFTTSLNETVQKIVEQNSVEVVKKVVQTTAE